MYLKLTYKLVLMNVFNRIKVERPVLNICEVTTVGCVISLSGKTPHVTADVVFWSFFSTSLHFIL